MHNIIGDEIIKVNVSTPYSANSDSELYPIAQAEIAAIDANGVYPSISTTVENIVSYDTLYVCYPLWYSRMSTPMQSFLHTYGSQLAGKTIGLICTSASSGISATVSDARRLCPGANFMEPLWIRSSAVANSRGLISEWLKTYAAMAVEVVADARPQVWVNASRLCVSGEFQCLEVYNINGSVVMRGNESATDVSNLPAGVYFVRIKTNTESFSRKIFKK